MSDLKTTYTISELRQMLDVTARTLRFYESEGLISPIREGQTRKYTQEDVARVRWILRGKRVGFSLADISEMLDLYNLGDGRTRQREVTLDKCQDRLEDLIAQREDLNHMICELQNFVDLLNDLREKPENDETVSKKIEKLREFEMRKSHADL